MEVEHYAALSLCEHHYGFVGIGEREIVGTECNLLGKALVHLLHGKYLLAGVKVVHGLGRSLQCNVAPPRGVHILGAQTPVAFATAKQFVQCELLLLC